MRRPYALTLMPVAALSLALVACSAQSLESDDGGGDTTAATPGEDGEAISYDSLPFTDILPLDEGAAAGGEDLTIGFSQTCFNHPWRTAMIDSAEAEIARHDNVELVVADGNCDVAKQSNDVADLLARGVDAVVLSPVESAGLAQAARSVLAAGVPLIVLDRDVPADKTVFIGQSNVELAYETAKKMVDDLGGEGNIVEITGLAGSSAAVDRSEGLHRALAEAPGITVLASGDGEWVREPAVALMEDWLTRYDDIDAVFSHAEESSWGAMQAIDNAGRCDDTILQYTHDGSAAGFEVAQAGDFAGDGNYSPFIGDIGVRAALLAIAGEEIPGTTEYDEPGQYLELPALPLVTPDNAGEWVSRGWGDFDAPLNPCDG